MILPLKSTELRVVMSNVGTNRSSQMPISTSASILHTVMMHGGRAYVTVILIVSINISIDCC